MAKSTAPSSSNLGLYAIGTVVVLILIIGVAMKILGKESITQVVNQHDYVWQNTCDKQCADLIGSSDMDVIDGWGCGDLLTSRSFMQSLLSYHSSHPDVKKFQPVVSLKALNDKIMHIGCR